MIIIIIIILLILILILISCYYSLLPLLKTVALTTETAGRDSPFLSRASVAEFRGAARGLVGFLCLAFAVPEDVLYEFLAVPHVAGESV